MRIKFYLKRPKPGPGASAKAKAEYKDRQNSPTAIYALINYDGNSLKIYTSESIIPQHWNPETNSARNTPKFPEHPEFNERLNQIKSTINRVFLDYRNKNGHAAPSPAIFRSLIETAMKKGAQRLTFLDYFEDFVNRSMRGQRINPRSKHKSPVGLGVTKGYQTTLNHLRGFDRHSKRKLDFDTIDLEFHRDFTEYLTTAPVGENGKPLLLSANTVGSNFQRIKAVLSEATERGYNSNMTFRSKYFVKQTEDSEAIFLSIKELQELEKLELNASLDNVRDLFLIGCYTGLRYSDFSILQPENIKDGFIRINQTKTKSPVTIPVHEVVKRILEKRGGQTPRAISNEKINAYLKKIGEMLPSLSVLVSKTITRGGVRVEKTYSKWQLITTHSARRSFATNEYLAGTPSLTIMAITGHKTEKNFLKYIKVTAEDHAHKMKSLWDKRSSGLKAV